MVENVEEMANKARGTLELTQKISTMGILILKENDKRGVEEKMKTLKEYLGTVPGKSREEFNRYVFIISQLNILRALPHFYKHELDNNLHNNIYKMVAG